nr:LysR family transcriptional regulator [Nannocystis pusilla]
MDLLSQMATFVRIVEGGSLSAAARRLRLSTPAISRQLRALEEELGATLVLRTTRRLTVTEVGRAYYERCVQILREVEEAQTAARRSDAVEGRLVVAASVTFGGLRVAPTLPALFAAHPRLRVDLRLEDRLTDLVGDGVDVAIRATTLLPQASDALIAVPLSTVPRVAVAAPSYLRRRGEPKEPAALARHDALVQVYGSGRPRPAGASPGRRARRRCPCARCWPATCWRCCATRPSPASAWRCCPTGWSPPSWPRASCGRSCRSGRPQARRWPRSTASSCAARRACARSSSTSAALWRESLKWPNGHFL